MLRGTERTVIAAIGDERAAAGVGVLESGPGVDEVLPVLAPYKIASIETKVGADRCPHGQPHDWRWSTRRDRRPLLGRKRRANREHGPRDQKGRGDGTARRRVQAADQPYSFQGHKEEGLKMLAAARAETGLAIVTEVVAAEDVELVCRIRRRAADRRPQHAELPVARSRRRTHRPVLLKRGPSATIEELLLAAEYILDGGNQQVMLCERGIRTFEAHTRFTLPLATVPYLHAKTHLPVVVDPSHGTGHTPLVAAMARAAVAAGADGIIVEVHPNPEKRLATATNRSPLSSLPI